ncbi:DUF1295-domain-containing protein [Fistulina hepatica ATCC 64428]|uniref:DUF1295-domain-containing protein n=1 Tax=Fistulina hepatica ATCC 64428 TaxID=1128425 RepID=A0A0D7A346_9AGAR|nr:DUF1295-domain-containing protein [Fistulina hepatica ATCC 64428]
MNFFDSTASSVYAWPLQFCAFNIAQTYIFSLITSNVSQVDRIWTFLPVIYAAYFAFLPILPRQPSFFLCPYVPENVQSSLAQDFSPRVLLMFSLIVLWMVRLSYNTYRRGLFNLHDEDYRWAVLRQKISVWLFQVTNLVFIAGIQNALLLLLAYPVQIASSVQPHKSLTCSDVLLGFSALVILGLEFTADNQQWAFHAYKHSVLASKKGDKSISKYDEKAQWPGSRLKWTEEDAQRGFITRGLWAYSRHPNFACEQSFWWVITLMPLMAPEPPSLPSLAYLKHVLSAMSTLPPSHIVTALSPCVHLAPAVALSLLFYSSTLFTESITASKYKAYSAYKQRVAMFGFLKTFWLGMYLYIRGDKNAVEAQIWTKGKTE